MPKGWTITTKEGETLTIDEWLEKKDKINSEFSKLQEKEVIEQKKCLRRRIGQNGISPEYNEGYSEVRHLTEEEIKKEYKMGIKEGTITRRGNTIRELIKFLQELEGRKVSTDVIVQGIKKPTKSVSSFLSQLFNAGVVARIPMKDHKRKFVWGISDLYLKQDLEAIVFAFNDFVYKKRRNQYLKSKEEKGITYHSKEEHKKEQGIDQYLKSKEETGEIKISTPSSNTLKIVVEGNIKILFGLAK